MPSPDERPAARPRPDYGLPGPTPSEQSANGADSSRPEYGRPDEGRPATGQPAGGSAAPFESSAPSAPSGFVMPSGGAAATTAPPRRRGKLPLILGIILIVAAFVIAIVGLVLGVRSIMGAVGDGPAKISNGTADVKLDRLEMLVVYVPSEDADSATCTTSSPGDKTVETESAGQSITFPDGSSYVQKLGVAATDSTTVTLTCKGTSSADAAYIGPMNPTKMLLPLIGGPALGVMIGLVGLVLAIIGIVLLVRTRRA
ncbi:hypothetical protein DEO23_05265 [Brachybacterium endophyticum]|uniref:Uncharacterized protein n=1 Tax=Brachybacterium endophyticum TaxID=2182385 RepID=A0A2U2RKR2_9MICO|nr:hypothetical protein [Brachybacterium endophyticum]PWH06385.1 hypothetical protein DEO23_05265 [Brachybacterium endophyticum]